MKILGLIPARAGSKGIKNKNIVPLCGKPLLFYTAEAALSANNLDRVILSTDSNEIASVGRDAGLDVPFLRPPSLAQDDTPTLPVLLHVLEQLEKTGEYYDGLCLLQPTSPLRTCQMIDEACNLFVEKKADTVLSVLPIPHQYHPEWALTKKEDGSLQWACGQKEPISRRQLLTPAFHREGSIYIVRTDVMRKSHSLYGEKIVPYVVDPEKSVNIDGPVDLDKAKKMIERKS